MGRGGGTGGSRAWTRLQLSLLSHPWARSNHCPSLGFIPPTPSHAILSWRPDAGATPPGAVEGPPRLQGAARVQQGCPQPGAPLPLPWSTPRALMAQPAKPPGPLLSQPLPSWRQGTWRDTECGVSRTWAHARAGFRGEYGRCSFPPPPSKTLQFKINPIICQTLW